MTNNIFLLPGNFKDGIRYGKYGPVGSDKKKDFEIKHSAKRYNRWKSDKLIIFAIYSMVFPACCVFLKLRNDSKEAAPPATDSILPSKMFSDS